MAVQRIQSHGELKEDHVLTPVSMFVLHLDTTLLVEFSDGTVQSYRAPYGIPKKCYRWQPDPLTWLSEKQIWDELCKHTAEGIESWG